MNARDRSTIGVGIIVVASLFAVKRVPPNWRAWQDGNASAAASAVTELASARQASRLLPALRDSLRVRRALLAGLDSNLTRAPSAAIASVEVAALVAALAADNGVNVVSQQIVPDSTAAPGIHRVTIRLLGTADVESLAALLRDISGNDRLLAVREISVAQSDPTASARVETLRVELSIDALCAIGAPRA